MKNKVLIELLVPEIDETYNVYLPINKRIGKCITLLIKAINDINFSNFINNNECVLVNRITGETYDKNLLIRNTNIRNGATLILIKN